MKKRVDTIDIYISCCYESWDRLQNFSQVSYTLQQSNDPLTAVTLFLSCVYSGVLTNKPRWGDNPLVHSSTTNTQSQVISQTSCMKTHSVRVNIISIQFLRFCRIQFDVVFSARFHILGLPHGNWKKNCITMYRVIPDNGICVGMGTENCAKYTTQCESISIRALYEV